MGEGGQLSPQPPAKQLVEAMNGAGAGLFGPVGLERVTPGMVIDVASLILQGFHAVPVKLKMLLDRLFSLLSPEEITAVLRGFGWTIQDYQRGYILKNSQGANLDKWRMCTAEDEPLILQQFLRFSVTRPLTQQLILQELCEKNADTKQKLQEHMMKLMSNNNTNKAVEAEVTKQSSLSASSPTSQQPPTSPASASSASHLSPSSSHSRTSPESVLSPSSVPTTSHPPAALNGSAGVAASPITSSSSIASPSPLNKLQSMHPFDYRKSERRTPEIPRSPVEKPIPPSMSPMRLHQPGLPGYPVPPSFPAGCGYPSLAPGLAPYQHQLAAARFHEQAERAERAERKPKEENSMFNPMNLSRGQEMKAGSHRAPGETHSGPGRRPLGDTRHFDAMFDDLGTSFVNPTTGKKRVQCNVCLKTFCDKGALKIHFSAVHLREMHKCTVPGCNMMFSSRRSRNRHSANPNPKLHTPHIRRKISPHDGRTHQGPVLPFDMVRPKPPPPPPPISSHLQHPGHNPGLPPFHHFPNIPPHLITPELQKMHHHQMELQRIQEMQKLSSLYSRRLAESGGFIKRDNMKYKDPDKDQQSLVSSEAKSESETDDQKADITDDDKSVDNQSAKDEITGVGRKRKSQNPTRITHSENRDDDVNYSSDDNDEGFPDPMDDDDEEDETLMDYDSTDDADDQIRLAKERKLNNPEEKKNENEEMTESDKLKNDPNDKQDDHQSSNEGKENISDSEPGMTGQDEKFGGTTGKIQVRNDLTENEKNTNGSTDDVVTEEGEDDLSGSGPLSPTGSDYQGILDADIPIDKENPRRCVDCGKEFQNHFAVKIHYQNVHLKLMHKCTVDGCNAAFPSKRSRDRHSSNLTLHRKLLSTSDTDHHTGPETTGNSSAQPDTIISSSSSSSSTSHLPPAVDSGSHNPPPPPPPPPYQHEFLARFLAEQQQRLTFPFLPSMTSSPHAGHLNTAPTMNNTSACKGSGLIPPPFGMFPFNPLLGDMSRLPGLFHKTPGMPDQAGPNKMMEENLRKYMAMAGIVNKIENH